MEGNGIPRILIVSEGNYPKDVKSITWDNLDGVPNIAEFDIVILNLVNLTSSHERYQIDLELLEKDIHNLLWGKSELILITDGERYLTVSDQVRSDIFSILPIYIPLVKGTGDTIIVEEDEYQDYYTNYVNYWQFYITEDCEFSPQAAQRLLPRKEYDINYDLTICKITKIIARNGFNRPISFSVKYGYNDYIESC